MEIKPRFDTAVNYYGEHFRIGDKAQVLCGVSSGRIGTVVELELNGDKQDRVRLEFYGRIKDRWFKTNNVKMVSDD